MLRVRLSTLQEKERWLKEKERSGFSGVGFFGFVGRLGFRVSLLQVKELVFGSSSYPGTKRVGLNLLKRYRV